MEPFRRGRFADLPEKPHRPHRWFDLPARTVRVTSSDFGALDIHYREAGAGPPLLLVHGLMTTSYSWRYVVDDLARSFRVIALDLPGCGRSDKPRVVYSGDALARFLIEFQRALGIRGCLVIGNTMGGMLCMRAALLDGETFSRMVNIHSPGPPGFRYSVLHAALSVPPLRGLLGWWIKRDPRRWAHRNVHYHDESLKSLEEAGEYGDPLATPDGNQAFIRYLWQTFAPRDLRGFMHALATQKFPIPLLLIYSRQDPLVPPAIGDELHRLVAGSKLVWLEDTSHFAHVDTPDKVIGPALEFLLGG